MNESQILAIPTYLDGTIPAPMGIGLVKVCGVCGALLPRDPDGPTERHTLWHQMIAVLVGDRLGRG